MWIECSNEATRRLYDDEFMDEPLEFNDSGSVQVKKEVGEQMIEHYPSISESGSEEEEAVETAPDDVEIEETVDVDGHTVDELDVEMDDADDDETE